jgi:hypothetical protein
MKRFVVLAALFACGCSSTSLLADDPLIFSRKAIEPPNGCNTEKQPWDAADPDAKQLCGALYYSNLSEAAYITAGADLEHWQTGFGGAQIASAASVAGFSLFDAAKLNTKIATFVGALATAGRSGLKPGQKATILIDASEKLKCVSIQGRKFIEYVPAARAARANLMNLLDQAASARASLMTSLPTKKSPAASRLAVIALLDWFTPQAKAALDAANARLGAAARVDEIRYQIEHDTLRQLRGLSPDFDALSKTLQTPAPTGGATPPPKQDEPSKTLLSALNGMARGDRTPNAMSTVIESLSAGGVASILADTTPGEDEFKAIGTCAS